MNKEETLKYIEDRKEIANKVKNIIVEQLCLDMPAEFIADNQPLFGRGLELDSIDALELAVGIFSEFSVSISDGDSQAFGSVNNLVDFIIDHKEE